MIASRPSRTPSRSRCSRSASRPRAAPRRPPRPIAPLVEREPLFAARVPDVADHTAAELAAAALAGDPAETALALRRLQAIDTVLVASDEPATGLAPGLARPRERDARRRARLPQRDARAARARRPRPRDVRAAVAGGARRSAGGRRCAHPRRAHARVRTRLQRVGRADREIDPHAHARALPPGAVASWSTGRALAAGRAAAPAAPGARPLEGVHRALSRRARGARAAAEGRGRRGAASSRRSATRRCASQTGRSRAATCARRSSSPTARCASCPRIPARSNAATRRRRACSRCARTRQRSLEAAPAAAPARPTRGRSPSRCCCPRGRSRRPRAQLLAARPRRPVRGRGALLARDRARRGRPGRRACGTSSRSSPRSARRGRTWRATPPRSRTTRSTTPGPPSARRAGATAETARCGCWSGPFYAGARDRNLPEPLEWIVRRAVDRAEHDVDARCACSSCPGSARCRRRWRSPSRRRTTSRAIRTARTPTSCATG